MIRTGKAGKGTYGIVYNAETIGDDKRQIAVKRNIIDESVSFSGSLKEMDLLSKLKGHPYIVKLLSVSFSNPFIVPNSPVCRGGDSSYREDYLHFIFEQANTNGHDLIHGGVPMCYMKLAMLQMFLAIEYMHAKNVMHRDIKPGNLLWFVTEDNKAAVKLCDFGLSKMHTTGLPMTPKVVTCWYRAPEICSRDPQYGFASDIWSAGCVMYEMVAKNALLAGYSDNDTKILSKIIGIIPQPSYEEIYKLTNGHKITLTSEASPRHRQSFKDMIDLTQEEIDDFNSLPKNGATYDQYLDLLTKIMVLDPDKRLTITEILDHPFFEPYREIIKWTHENYPPVPPEPKPVYIICCRERAWACKAAFLVFNGRACLSWYKHSIIFQSIDLFDRYLHYLHVTHGKRLTESKYQGKYLTRYYAELHYIVCLYMCIKYFTTLHIPISFHELASDHYRTEKAMIEAEEFEKKMLKDVLKLHIYRDTIYEVATNINHVIPDEYQTRDLLDRYGNINKHYSNISVSDLYDELTKPSEPSE